MLLIPLLVVAVGVTYLSFSWLGPLWGQPLPFSLGLTPLLIMVGCLLWLFLVYFRSGEEHRLRAERLMVPAAFASLGLLSFLFFFTALRDVASVIVPHLRGVDSPAVIAALAVAAFLFGAAQARLRLVTKEVDLPITGLPEAFDGFRLVQLSDVHLGTGIKLAQWQGIVARVKPLKPDAIALTGDIIDGAVADLGPEMAVMKELCALAPTAYVLGNHEYYWNPATARDAMSAAGARVLINESWVFERRGAKLALVGAAEISARHFGGPAVDLATPVAALSSSIPRILLAHQPSVAPAAAQAGYAAQLSGHTHAGQIIPWTWFSKLIHRHNAGLSFEGPLAVYVNQGTGYWGPPLRFGTSCEVTIFTLRKR
jgi:predicted MPP superfamily phosphohydrolase